MSVPIEHRCASCATLHSTTRRTRPVLGRPFETCRRCGGFVPLPPAVEWAALPAGRKLALLGEEGLVAASLGLVPALVLGFWALRARTPDRPTIAWTALAGLTLALWVRGAAFARRVRHSKRRLADPMYRAKWVEFEIATRPAQGRSVAR